MNSSLEQDQSQNKSIQGVLTKLLNTGCVNKATEYRVSKQNNSIQGVQTVSKQNMCHGFNLKKTKGTRAENFRMVDIGIND